MHSHNNNAEDDDSLFSNLITFIVVWVVIVCVFVHKTNVKCSGSMKLLIYSDVIAYYGAQCGVSCVILSLIVSES